MRAQAGRDDRLKVIRIIARLNIGGPARHAAILHRGLAAEGFETRLVYGSPAPGEGSLEALVGDDGTATPVRALGRRLHLWSDAQALRHLTRLIFRERPDVVHTHTAKAGTLGRLAAVAFNRTRPRRERCLVVHTFHGHVFSGYFGALGSAAARSAERALAAVTDRIVTISAGQQREIAASLGPRAARRMVVVPLGLDLRPLLELDRRRAPAATAASVDGADVVFGYIGRFVPIKDLPTLLRAFAIVARAAPRCRLLLVGDGELRRELERTADALGVGALVRFGGWQLDLQQVYTSVDAIVLSSLNEGTPVALIEAMAAALPVVATAVGGVPDVVEDGRTGLLVPPRQPERLAEQMLRLARDPALGARLGNAARADVRERFAADRLVRDVAALYREGLDRKRGTR